MTNFHDPDVTLRGLLAATKLYHVVGGLYIWEFITNLDYEWRVIKGRLPYRWTIWLYSLTRVATLGAVAFDLAMFSITARMNCRVADIIGYILGYSISVFSSLLIILRIIAIWNKNMVIVTLTSIIWVVNFAFLVYGISQVRSSWDPDNFCGNLNVRSNVATVISIFVSDFILLTIMLVGLLRLRRRGAGTFALGRLLWTQGVIWLLLATAAELPPAVFLTLNLNEALNVMLAMPSLITMSISATRMYRSLADFLHSTDVRCHRNMDSDTPPRVGPAAPDFKSTMAMATSTQQVEVAVHTTHEKYPSSPTDESVLYIGRDCPPQLHRNKFVLDVEVERDV